MLENNTARFVFLILGAIVLSAVVVTLTDSWESIQEGFNAFSHINDRKCSRTNKDSGDFIYDFKERVLMMENTFMEDINFSKYFKL